MPWHLHDTYEEKKKVEKLAKATPQDSNFIDTAVQDKEKNATVYHRYYHVFREGELESLISQHLDGKLVLEERYYDHANWVVKLKKVA